MSMIEILACDLEGPALDWVIATIEALPIRFDPMGFIMGSEAGYWIWGDGVKIRYQLIGREYSPSKHPAQGTQLMESERLYMQPATYNNEPGWEFWAGYDQEGGKIANVFGPTMLIAAMRCIVIKRRGAKVQIPNLLK